MCCISKITKSDDYIKSHFISSLDEANNENLIDFKRHVEGKRDDNLILLYKQVLCGAMQLGRKDLKKMLMG